MTDPSRPQISDPTVGLCSTCRHASVQHSAKGSAFWRCRAADDDPKLRRYPPLPVLRCPGFAGGEANPA